MHPYLIQSIAEERTREQRELAQRSRDSVVAAGPRPPAAASAGAHPARKIVRLLPTRRGLA